MFFSLLLLCLRMEMDLHRPLVDISGPPAWAHSHPIQASKHLVQVCVSSSLRLCEHGQKVLSWEKI